MIIDLSTQDWRGAVTTLAQELECLKAKLGTVALTGWRCPNCGAGVAPSVQTCPYCAPPLKVTS